MCYEWSTCTPWRVCSDQSDDSEPVPGGRSEGSSQSRRWWQCQLPWGWYPDPPHECTTGTQSDQNLGEGRTFMYCISTTANFSSIYKYSKNNVYVYIHACTHIKIITVWLWSSFIVPKYQFHLGTQNRPPLYMYINKPCSGTPYKSKHRIERDVSNSQFR